MFDFSNMPEVDLVNFKGGNGTIKAIIYNDDNVKIMRLRLAKGVSLGKHSHDSTFEAVYVINGIATFNLDGKEEKVAKGCVHYCAKGHSHSVINNENEELMVYCVIGNC